MTAVPDVYGSGVQLICDSCGAVAEVGGCGLHESDVVYVAVTTIGWAGSVLARGPHRCPSCRPVGARVRSLSQPLEVSGRVHRDFLPSTAVIRVTGGVDGGVACELQAALDAALAKRVTVVVDLSGAASIDTAGVGVFVRARNVARRRRGELRLAAPSRSVQAVLRLHTTFRAYRTVEHAVTATRVGSYGRSG
jgi:anti-sigma B factor antagonist